MTQIPAGWYPDPDTSNPDAPRGQRYWDGRQWTEHVSPPPGRPAGQPGPGSQYGSPYTPMTPYAAGPAVPTTPDGQVLSGWWRRVAAYVIDLIIVGVIAAVVGFRWVSEIVSAYSHLVSQAMDAAQNGTTPPDQMAVVRDVAGPVLAISLIGIVVNFAYQVGFLKWKAATPGKLLIGLRVRLRETPGPLSWRTVLMRWLGQWWYSLFGLVPFIGGVLGLYRLIDGLWPLWDDKRQALHDKVARTNVVRVR